MASQKASLLAIITIVGLFSQTFPMLMSKHRNFAGNNLNTDKITNTYNNQKNNIHQNTPVVEDFTASLKTINIGDNQILNSADITGTIVVPADPSTEDGTLHPDTIEEMKNQLEKQGYKLELTLLE